jgi:hypothetical protein|tara:strand:- start:643 stop:1104 length:462 start_codon:yes stop_codon:yes gene_type:complete
MVMALLYRRTEGRIYFPHQEGSYPDLYIDYPWLCEGCYNWASVPKNLIVDPDYFTYVEYSTTLEDSHCLTCTICGQYIKIANNIELCSYETGCDRCYLELQDGVVRSKVEDIKYKLQLLENRYEEPSEIFWAVRDMLNWVDEIQKEQEIDIYV